MIAWKLRNATKLFFVPSGGFGLLLFVNTLLKCALNMHMIIGHFHYRTFKI